MQQTTTLGMTSALTPRSPEAATSGRSERRFFGGMAVAFGLVVIAGFSRSYYFNSYAVEPFELSPLLHWHGAVYTAWMLLLVTQTTLIAAQRTHLHRQLGVAGAVLAVAMIGLGAAVAVSRTASGAIADQGVPPLLFLAVPLLGMVVFATLVGAALHQRRRSAAHKRLMLLATLELVTAAVSRLPLVEDWGPVGFFGVTDLFVVAIVVYDLVTLRRVHAATLWGGLIFVVSQPLRLVIGGTPTWLAFAAWLTA